MAADEPELLDAELDPVAADGDRVRVPRAAWPSGDPPYVGRAAVLRDGGLSKPGVVAGIESNGDLAVDVTGDRVRSFSPRPRETPRGDGGDAAAAELAALLAPFVNSSGRLVDVPPSVAAEALSLLPGDLAHDRLNGVQPPMTALVLLAKELGGRLVGALAEGTLFLRFGGIQVPAAVAGGLAERVDTGWPATTADPGALACATAEAWPSWTAGTSSWRGIGIELLSGDLPAEAQVVGLWWD